MTFRLLWTRKPVGLWAPVSLAALLFSGCESHPPPRPWNPDSPATFLKRVMASDAQDEDRFGSTVDIDGDLVVVGTNNMFAHDYRPGKAFIYSRNEGGADAWGEVLRLAASDGEDVDLFGYAVSADGDKAIIGAGAEDNIDIDVGAAYLYSRNEGGTDRWGERKKMIPSDGQSGDGFGYTVSLDGDTALIGAPLRSETAWASGAAYLFARDQGGTDNWGEVKKILPAGLPEAAGYGYAVAVNGSKAVVGAMLEDGAGENRGAAYIFYRDSGGPGNWGEVKKLTAFDAEDRDQYGISVCISEDLLIIGAGWKHEAGVEMGAAYIYSRNAGGPDNWGLVKKLSASDGTFGDGFGFSVSLSADHAIIGAPGKGGEIMGLGAVYVFQRDLGGLDNWGEAGKIVPVDANETCWFGYSTAISGDRFAVGAPFKRGGQAHGGAVYLFRLRS